MTAPYRVVVVDDEPLARERVVTLLGDAADFEVVAEASHGLAGLDRIVALRPDVAFVDVEMPELSGLGLVAALEAEQMPEVVFVTAFDRYALEAFEVGAIDYLQKPVTPSRFAATLARLRERLGRGSDGRAEIRSGAVAAERASGFRTRFVVRRGSTHTFVAAAEVDWIDAADNYLRLHVGARWHLVRGTMKDAEAELDPATFIRIHRSAMVNVERIESVETQPGGGYIVTVAGGTRLRTSRQYSGVVRAAIKPGRAVGSIRGC